MNDNISGTETVYKTSGIPVGIELEVDQTFDGRYVIIKRLGAGGMGTAYLAKDQLTNEEVVIKVIHPSLLDEESKRRMIAEGVNARKIKHPNVVTVHDVKEVDGQVYLTMEHVEGQPLRNWMAATMASGVNAPVDQVVGIVKEVLSGLAAAHAAGVIHRDLKPENIMLQGTPGEGDIGVKIIDFGIATGLKTAGTTTSVGAIGAPLYMAPEQLTTPDLVRPTADIYSVGRMFYEMLMDVLPDGMWNPPSAARSDVPPALDGVIQKALQPPNGRYRSAEDFLTAINQGMAGDVEPLKPPIFDITKKRSWTWAYVVGGFTAVALLVDQSIPDGNDDIIYDDFTDDIIFDDGQDDFINIINDDVVPPPAASFQSWRGGDGNVFDMTVSNGVVNGSGFMQPWGAISLQGNLNTYVDVYNTQGQNVAALSGGLVPSNSGPGIWDYSGSVMVNGQIVGSYIFHIDH